MRTTVPDIAARLPVEPSSFVGRVRELARLGEMLAAARLVTVTGPGGVGKTRLALRAVAEAEARFPDGVRLIELSALRDPELLANTVSAGLELSEQDPRPRLEQVLDYLGERRVLLILDTCEHLVDACALFAESVLSQTEHVTILATSRQPLLVTGEQEYPLPPLDIPGPRTARDGDAVSLFAQRAAAAVPGFEVTEANSADVARLCRDLDGMPLAIELAAGRLREQSLTDLTRRLEGRLFLDATGSQDTPVDRHRTLRDAIGWSYALCTAEEQALWERLAVFAGPVSADAAQQVCAGPGLDREAVMTTLFGLVDKSVLTRIGGDSSRYRMLDTVREYGGERLAASEIQSRVRARHLHRYLAMAGELTARPLERQLPKYLALRAEHADIRAALEYAATLSAIADLGQPAVQLPTRLEWYWVLSGRFQEARYWLTRALELAPEPGPDRARVLTTRGYVTTYQGDPESALADVNEAVALADDLGDRHLKARALVYLAYILITENHLEESKKTAIEAERLFDREDELAGLPIVLTVVKSYADLLTGDVEGCLRHCERSLRSIPDDGDERWGSGYLLGLVGLALSLLGEPDRGNKAALRGLAMKHELRDVVGMAHCLGVASLASSAQQRHERTAWLIAATGPLWEQLAGAYMGVNEMQMFTEQAAGAARAELGDDWYAEVVRDALARSIDEVVDVAVRDVDQIPTLPHRS